MKTLKMLAIDLGASSGRGIVGSFDGEKLTLSENHRFTNDPVNICGRFSWDIMRIFFEIKNSIRKCVLDGNDVASVGIDTWGVDYGLISPAGHLLTNPVHYRDLRTDNVTDYVSKSLPIDEIFRTTGIQSADFNTIYQLACEVRDNPKLLECAGKVLHTPDLLGYFLTGNAKSEYTIASTGAILNAKTRTYATDLLEKLNIPTDIFAELVDPGYCLGELLPQVKEDVGETDMKVIKVASHDTASAVLAVPAKSEGFVYISSGTWSLMGMELKNPIMTAEADALGFTNEGGVNGTIRFLKNIMGLWILQESRRQWKREGKDYSFDDLARMAKTAKPLQSIINPNDKLFSQPGNMPRRIVDYCKNTNQHIPENEGEIVRCILDSLGLCYRDTIASLRQLMGKSANAVNIVGGGTQDKLLCQITADACGLPVCAGPIEATATGNILMQAMAAGEIANVDQAREVVRASFSPDYYQPTVADAAMWDDAADRFSVLCTK